MKLSEAQKNVIRKMREGDVITYSTYSRVGGKHTTRIRIKLDTITRPTFEFLEREKLIQIDNGKTRRGILAVHEYELTELGKTIDLEG